MGEMRNRLLQSERKIAEMRSQRQSASKEISPREWIEAYRKLHLKVQNNTYVMICSSLVSSYCTVKFFLSTTDEDVRKLEERVSAEACLSSSSRSKLDGLENHVDVHERKLLKMDVGLASTKEDVSNLDFKLSTGEDRLVRCEKGIEKLTLKKAQTPTLLSRLIGPPVPRLPQDFSSLVTMRQYRDWRKKWGV